MKLSLATLGLFAFLGVACAQAPLIRDYKTTPDVIETSVNGLICGHYAQHPANGQIQIWCRINGVTVLNGVFTVGNGLGFVCSAVSQNFDLGWAMIPATSPMIGYQFAVQATTTGAPLFFGSLPLGAQNLAVASGTF